MSVDAKMIFWIVICVIDTIIIAKNEWERANK